MRFKMIVTLIFVSSLSVFASASAAQSQAQYSPALPPSAQSAQVQQQSANPAVPFQRPMGPVIAGAGMMPPGMMQAMGPMLLRSQDAGGRGQGSGGPLQWVSKLLATLDDTRIRTMLGLTDQQAESLRKIVVDTETFTIKTGADIAVDSIDLRELLRADKPDRAAVTTKGDEISKSTSQLINHYLDAMLAAKAILTPEQQKMIRAYLESGAPAFPVPTARP
jgi:Spy/CpxP family protein refolding chaperone